MQPTTTATKSCSHLTRPINVRAQPMAGNTSEAFDIKRPTNGNAPPLRHRRFADAEFACERRATTCGQDDFLNADFALHAI